MKKNKKKYFSYYINLWIENKKFTVKESTYCYYLSLINNHINPFFENELCRKIDENKINCYINYINNKNVSISNKTLRDILIVLRQILDCAKINIKINLPKLVKNETKIFSYEEQKKFELETNTYEDIVKYCMYLCLYTGLRIGEACALRWKDIDLKNKILYVSNTMIRIKNLDANKKHKTKIIISKAKTNNSIRVIPLPERIIKVLKIYYTFDEDFIITGSKKIMEPRVLHNKFKKVLKKCKIKDYKFHVLRHTFASNCIKKGVDPKTLSEILGHSDVRLTLSLYVHSDIEFKRKMMELLYINS